MRKLIFLAMISFSFTTNDIDIKIRTAIVNLYTNNGAFTTNTLKKMKINYDEYSHSQYKLSVISEEIELIKLLEKSCEKDKNRIIKLPGFEPCKTLERHNAKLDSISLVKPDKSIIYYKANAIIVGSNNDTLLDRYFWLDKNYQIID